MGVRTLPDKWLCRFLQLHTLLDTTYQWQLQPTSIIKRYYLAIFKIKEGKNRKREREILSVYVENYEECVELTACVNKRHV